MAHWIRKYAPEHLRALERGEVRLTPLYKRLRNQFYMRLADEVLAEQQVAKSREGAGG
jgi:hypothetical protein